MPNALPRAERDGKLIFGGNFIDGGTGGDYVQPTLVEVPPGHALAREEQFLPMLALRCSDSLQEALVEGNSVRYGLTAGASLCFAKRLQS